MTIWNHDAADLKQVLAAFKNAKITSVLAIKDKHADNGVTLFDPETKPETVYLLPYTVSNAAAGQDTECYLSIDHPKGMKEPASCQVVTAADFKTLQKGLQKAASAVLVESVDGDEYLFAPEFWATAKLMKRLDVSGGYSGLTWDVTLDSEGNITIGCADAMSLDLFAGQKGLDLIHQEFGEPYQCECGHGMVEDTDLKFYTQLRDALVPILRAKVAEMNAKPKAKKSKKAKGKARKPAAKKSAKKRSRRLKLVA